jgi:DNA-binding NarL/FixJ family response regulator
VTAEEARKQLKVKPETIQTPKQKIKQQEDFLKGLSTHTDLAYQYYTERNRQMYIKKAQGKSFRQIADEYNLSTQRVSSIVFRIGYLINERCRDYEKYMDLLEYGPPLLRKGRMKYKK